uniref:BEACH domain-containing protein n=1 Tax=Timema poppense TaxID=170557 RepID=A0A7R9CQY8_TIMPO|nr:unnamed protein product [Timema poppensis]
MLCNTFSVTPRRIQILQDKLKDASTEQERAEIQRDSAIHHSKADQAYKTLADDGKNSNFVTICVDLQQVLFTPNLTHSDVYYQRHEGFFTEIQQKFLVTGHSFLPCDRDFALIERAKKKMKALVPSDWKYVIGAAKVNEPFTIFEMQQENFKDLEVLSRGFKNKAKLQITKSVWYKLLADDPTTLYARESHNVLRPWVPYRVFVNITQVRYCDLPPLYTEPLPISKEKKKDLLAMSEYLVDTEHQEFYKNLRSGLEVYCEGNSHLKHLYLSFKSPEDRDMLYQGLIGQHSLKLDNTDQEMMTLQWQNGVISNYDYLMYLNSLSDRTFNDLTQYPVFPWVISDMSSSTLDLSDSSCFRDLRKPVGALNPVRLKRLKERCEEMPPPKFLYGSHYSAPGFVLFYLVRKFPHYMLCLQNGSVPDVWKNVMNNMSDFKELIPAFYDTSQKGDFLVNSFGINFGNRHDGAKVGDVHLPLWAQGPEDFVRKLREALESDYVSKHLHHWIDLIFGCKQIGPEADKADNLFYYLCYEGSVDLDSIKDLNQRHALEVQIMEFGQIPKHIFTLPHPHRLMGLPPTLATSHSCDFSENDFRDVQECVQSLTGHVVWHRTETLMTVALFQSHKESVCATALSGSGQFVVSVGQDSLLKMYSLSEKRQVRSVTLSSMALSSCIVLPDEKTLIVGCWNNSIILYNLEFGRIVDSIRAHEDAVSCLCWTNSTQMLVSGSWDCSIRIWQGMAEGKRIKPATALVAQLDHDAHITCLDITRDGELLVSGTQEGDLFLWYMESHLLKQKMQGHSGSVYAASFSPDSKKLVSCGEDGSFKVVDLSTGMLLYSKTLEEELRCLCWDGFTLLLGGSLGSLYVWDLILVQLKIKICAHSGPVLTVTASDDGSLVVTGGQDRRVIVWQPAISS